MEYFLVDNGSLRAESILKLRRIAAKLSARTRLQVRPIGLMHSHKVDPEELGGVKAGSMQEFLKSAEAGLREEIRALPFFLGPSLAISDWLPKNLTAWRRENPYLKKFRILEPLYREGDERLVHAMVDLCRRQVKGSGFENPFVAMVDHGTPLLEVNQVREKVGFKMSQLLAQEISGFTTCAMERRPDPEYDFNDPLLEDVLKECHENGVGEVVVAQFFLLPGRHAGPSGDLAEICQPYASEGMKVSRTENLGEHSLIEEILLDRILEDQGL